MYGKEIEFPIKKKTETPNKSFNLIKPFVMVFAEQQCKNHANPSLRSGQALKVKPMLGRRSRAARKYTVKIYLMTNLIIKTRKNY